MLAMPGYPLRVQDRRRRDLALSALSMSACSNSPKLAANSAGVRQARSWSVETGGPQATGSSDCDDSTGARGIVPVHGSQRIGEDSFLLGSLPSGVDSRKSSARVVAVGTDQPISGLGSRRQSADAECPTGAPEIIGEVHAVS